MPESASNTKVSAKDAKKKTSNKKKQDHDEERYSRQMYALGARAHGLVRSTTAILDGPLGKVLRPTSLGLSSRGEHGFRSLHERESDGTSSISTGKEIPSGLLYEIAKNLALSGVGRIILVQDDDIDVGFFRPYASHADWSYPCLLPLCFCRDVSSCIQPFFWSRNSITINN
jgi:hypothetical protein